MRCILRPETNPYFNLSAEEYIFNTCTEDTFMLWRNEPAVIIGKHQNAFAEINSPYIKEKQIKVVRRISGGGAVYHDLGNLNFTFISNAEPEHLVDFNRFTTPITNALRKLELDVTTGMRNSLYLNGSKISGNAEHVYKNRVIHHGTLLFNSDLEALEESIKPPLILYNDKAVKSVRSRVTNISEHLKNELSFNEFAYFIHEQILRTFNGAYNYSFTEHDTSAIYQLMESKYNKWEWNYGYSPAFNFDIKFNPTGQSFNESGNPSELVDATLFIKNGFIEDFRINNGPVSIETEQTLRLLLNLPLNEEQIFNYLQQKLTPNMMQHLVISIFNGFPAEQLNNAGV